MVGKAQPFDITRKYGTPLRKDKSGNSEYLCYYIPYKYPNGAQGSRGFEGGYAEGSGSEVFDDLTIEFDAKGDIKSWRGYIQRLATWNNRVRTGNRSGQWVPQGQR